MKTWKDQKKKIPDDEWLKIIGGTLLVLAIVSFAFLAFTTQE